MNPSPLPAGCDPEAFRAMARSSMRAAYAGALAVVNRRADAEDVAQDALLAAFCKLDTCREPERFRSWLLQIVRNRALNWVERRRLRDVPEVEPAEPADLHTPRLPDVRLRERLAAALASLGVTQRRVVLLHEIEGWTHPEIADHLGISVLMSRKHLFQARRRLRALLERDREPARAPRMNRRMAAAG